MANCLRVRVLASQDVTTSRSVRRGCSGERGRLQAQQGAGARAWLAQRPGAGTHAFQMRPCADLKPSVTEARQADQNQLEGRSTRTPGQLGFFGSVRIGARSGAAGPPCCTGLPQGCSSQHECQHDGNHVHPCERSSRAEPRVHSPNPAAEPPPMAARLLQQVGLSVGELARQRGGCS